MARYGMVIDTRKCVGCMDCVVACKTENQVPEGFNRDWVTYETTGKFPAPHLEIRSERCNHCDAPPCVSCCPTGASHVEEPGGVVLVSSSQPLAEGLQMSDHVPVKCFVTGPLADASVAIRSTAMEPSPCGVEVSLKEMVF